MPLRMTALSLLSILLLAACQERAAGETLRVANGADIQSLDPHAASGLPDERVLRALYEGLVRLEPTQLEPLPGLADSWEVAEDGLTWRFHLRPEISWADGTPITAEDFAASWERLRDPATAAPYRTILDGIHWSAEHPTLTLQLDRPIPYLPQLLAYYPLAPLHPEARRAPPGVTPLGTPTSGPFRLKTYRLRDRISVEKNPNYWDADAVRLHGIDFLTVDSLFTGLNLYLSGQVDYLPDVPPAATAALAQREPGFAPSPLLGSGFYRVNCTRPPLDDPRVRLALSLAIDRATLAEGVMRGTVRAATSFCPPELPGYAPPEGPGFNLETARELLAAAGYPGGRGLRPLELLYNSSPVHRDVAMWLQQVWQQGLGVEVRLVQQEWKVYLDTQRRLDYDLARSSWIGDFADPITFLGIMRKDDPNNRTGFGSDEYDRLLTSALQPAVVERMRLLATAESLLLELAPLIPLWHDTNLEVVGVRVRGHVANPRAWHNWRDWEVLP